MMSLRPLASLGPLIGRVGARASPRPRVPVSPEAAGSSQSRHRPSDVYYIHHRQRVQDRGNEKKAGGGYSFSGSVFKKYII